MEINELLEPSFGLDSFQKPLVYKGSEALVKIILVVLFGKPGFYPSIPELGMHIQDYRHSKFEDLDLDAIKAQLFYQCTLLTTAIQDNMVSIQKAYLDAEHQQPVILFSIQLDKNTTSQEVLLGIKSDGDQVIYNYMLYDSSI